jgi:hypothetical protein
MKVRLITLGTVSAAMLAFTGTAGAGDVHAGGQDVHAIHAASSSWTGLRPGSSSWTGLRPGSSSWTGLHAKGAARNSFRPFGEKWGNG